MRNYRTAVLSALLALALAACTGAKPPPGDTYKPEDAFGKKGEMPAGATVVSPEEFARLAGANPDFLTRSELEAFQQAIARQGAEDDAAVSAFLKENPASAYLLDNEPGEETGDGDLIITVPAENVAGVRPRAASDRFVTLGRKSTVATMAANLRRFSTLENQEQLYESVYPNLPAELIQEAQLPTIEEARKLPREALLQTTQKASDFISRYSADGLLVKPVYDKVPPFLLRDLGEGSGLDTTDGTCPKPSANGIYANFDWPLKQFTTGVKNQGQRGTCWSFAVTAAAELLYSRANQRKVNLSEQEFAAHTLLEWNPREFGEGNDAFLAASGAHGAGYSFAYERGWEYNQSNSRTQGKDVQGRDRYMNSCTGYPDICSDTNFQGILTCALVPQPSGLLTFCVRSLPQVAGADRSSVKLDEPVNVWSQERDDAQNTAILTLRALFGQPTVLTFKVASSFDAPDANGFVTDSSFGQSTRGQHVALITGFVFNRELHQKLPNAPLADGDGYFVVKNSWGCSRGDAGYYYLPQRWVQRYAVGALGYY